MLRNKKINQTIIYISNHPSMQDIIQLDHYLTNDTNLNIVFDFRKTSHMHYRVAFQMLQICFKWNQSGKTVSFHNMTSYIQQILFFSKGSIDIPSASTQETYVS